MSSSLSERPALLGGSPVRLAGPPDWPLRDARVTEVFSQLDLNGDWGRYHGPWCRRLLEELGTWLQSRHVQLCCSGTAGIELALRGLAVQPGEEVLLAGYDFKSNFTNVHYLGAKPVLVDVRPEDAQLDVEQLESARSERTRCVIASHLHGGTVDLVALRSWADKYGLAIIEDACQAAGATVAGRPAGGWGDVGVLSFGGSKLLTAGRGGCVVTERDDVAQRIKLVSQRGNDAYPLSEMQAAVLLPQLEQLDRRHQQRAQSADWLRQHLSLRGLRALDSKRRDLVADGSSRKESPAYYKLGVWYDPTAFPGLTRNQLAVALRGEGIAIDAGFAALHRTHARSRFRAVGALPIASRAGESLLTLHHPVLLGTPADLAEIVTAVDKVAHWSEELGQSIRSQPELA
ncbi:MAG: DegT/DnrJ/EryC1/StrS family aminotransferase [Planctomycetaceae bacterium]